MDLLLHAPVPLLLMLLLHASQRRAEAREEKEANCKGEYWVAHATDNGSIITCHLRGLPEYVLIPLIIPLSIVLDFWLPACRINFVGLKLTISVQSKLHRPKPNSIHTSRERRARLHLFLSSSSSPPQRRAVAVTVLVPLPHPWRRLRRHLRRREAASSLYTLRMLETLWTSPNVSAARPSAVAARPSTSSPMDSFHPSCLPRERFVVFVMSTTGQGDPPDSMNLFWRYLLQKKLGARWLEGVRYAVFGLGDSGYQKYNLDKRLLYFGAEPIIDIGLGHDQHPSGYEGALDPWLLSLWESQNQTTPSLLPLPRMSDIIHPDLSILGDAKVTIIYYYSDEVQQDSNLSARSISPALEFINNDGESHYMLHMDMVTNQRLTKVDSDRDVRYFELKNPSYCPSAVDSFIERCCNVDPNCYIMTFVALTMDIASASPRRYFFEARHHPDFFATAEHGKEKLQYFASPEGRDGLHQYNQKESRTVLEVSNDFPSVQMPFEWLVPLTPPLKKRAFSISSSPLTKSNHIHLTVSIVSWRTSFKRTRHGLCSSWLAGLNPNQGTGCAPFRAFVAEMSAQCTSEPTAPILLFFGCRNQDNDFLYKEFWYSHAHDEGVLSLKKGGGLFVAFSRD
ncbi:hypothetical protein ABZP36_015946 [Zizania latifolia]